MAARTSEQAALRRVATLVVGAAPPEAVFTAVAEEVGRLLAVDHTVLVRSDPDDMITVVGTWTGTAAPSPVGERFERGGRNVSTLVLSTGRPARLDTYTDVSGAIGNTGVHDWGFRSSVGVPITVEGRPWGLIIVAYTRDEPLPPDTEARLVGFTELVATAIANAQARTELRGFAEEQAALRRVATLVARSASPEEVFAAVTAEVGRLLDADFTSMCQYEPDGANTILYGWSRTGADYPLPVGTRLRLGGRNLHTQVFTTSRPARVEGYGQDIGPQAMALPAAGVRSGVGAPVWVERRLWGLIIVLTLREESPPADTEARLAGFTELVATAIANAQARVELRGFADEQAALRRVATLVARAAPAVEVFAAVTAEVGRVLAADVTVLSRYVPDDALTVVGVWGSTGASPILVGTRLELGGRNVPTLVFQTYRPARIADYSQGTGPAADAARAWGLRSVVGVPVSVEGRLWGLMSVVSTRAEPLPADTEERLAGFTELVATAIANAEAQTALAASRARIVAAADAARRRLERDLHDGAQQHLVSVALRLRAMQAAPPGAGGLKAQLDDVVDELSAVLDELRALAHGLHPAALAEGGLRPALKTLARRSAVPVRLDVTVDERPPAPVELAAYYAVAEALTNTAKHAAATVIDVHVTTGDEMLRVRVLDDGRGGADLTHGTGLVGLTDRVEALGGRLSLRSPPGEGTTIQVDLPLTDPAATGSSALVSRRPDQPSRAAAGPAPPGPARGS